MKILFVDDHQLFREGVIEFFAKKKPEWEIDSCDTAEETCNFLASNSYDLLLSDLNFPENKMQGIDIIYELIKKEKSIPILILSMNSDISTIIKLIKLGIKGYVTKGINSDQLIYAVESLLKGEVYFDQEILNTIIGYISEERSGQALENTKLLDSLTDRENEIFSLLIRNTPVAEIAMELFISKKTVENHRTAIYKKLGVKDRMELFLLARKNNLF